MRHGIYRRCDMSGMRFLDLWFALSDNIPFWVNDGEDCTRYERKAYTPDEYDKRLVKYITMDGNGELTIEI